MKPHTFIIAVIAFLFCFLKTSAQEQKVSVGSQPAEIILMGNDLHVFCSGADMNGNGIVEKDSGDVEASWWIFDAATMNVKKSKVLEGGFLKGAPLNLAASNYYIFLFHGKKIKKYDRITQDKITEFKIPDTLQDINAMYNLSAPNADSTYIGLEIFSRYLDKDYYAYINIDSSNGKVHSYVVKNEFENAIQGFLSGSYTDEFPYRNYSAGVLITLYRGISGQKNSIISMPTSTSTTYATILGEGANFMKPVNYPVNFYSICVVMYDDHSIHIVDRFQGNILKTIPTQTTGFKGPRECAIDGDNLYVTTYNCDIRKFSISTGELLKIIPISGKADPIQIVNGKLIVGVTRTCDSLPNNSISIIDITTSVGEEEPFAISASVSPNPFKNSALISASFPSQINSATIEIFTSSGNSIGVFKKEVMNGELNFQLESDVLNLAQGQYMARISAGKQMSVVPFVIVK